ncbi:putative O-methyltransferase [Quillaja saponaria]|uniref:isoflavone 7-O-methyltransferase n=1 Tax=Quillaja saponaria TaxID=32244 RepID=A0AAD7P9T6_QUISA|nr:putative O-methyltransferase [Quillaja saponaria]
MDSINGNEASELLQAQTHLYKHMFNFISSMSLKCAIHLGIPDIIHKHGQPISLPELVSVLQIDPTKTGHVDRLMRLLVHDGFFAKTHVHDESKEQEAYVLTTPSKLLLKDKDPCFSSFVQAMLDPKIFISWHSMGDWLGGKELTPFEFSDGRDFWDWINQNPEHRKQFDETMDSDSKVISLALKDCKSVFEGLSSLLDVGGGTGTVAKTISEAFPHLKCTVLDLPNVVANLTGSENLNFVGGDMFQAIPPADAVLLKWILHDWDDDECIKILKNSKEAISSKGEGGKVIIIDIVINEKTEDHELTAAKLYFDMNMMVACNGQERNEKQWEKLLLEAGFRNYKITPIFGLKSLIEAYP